ncbi:MAG: hypothetical protein ACRDQ5_04945 [Sciscionella sp.]
MRGRRLPRMVGSSMGARVVLEMAELHWFAPCGHFPHWDKPHETIELTLSSTADPRGVA